MHQPDSRTDVNNGDEGLAIAMPDDRDRDRQVVRGGVITVGSTLMTVVLTMGATVILARLLTPEDFGLVAMAGILLTFLSKLRKFGLVDAVIHRADLDKRTLSGLFITNVKLSAVVLLVALIAAPGMALAFGREELILIISAIASANFIHCLGTVHEGLIRRRFQFGKTVFINSSAGVLSVTVAIIAAYYGMSYWALVLQEVVRELVLGVLLLTMAGWMPKRGLVDSASKQKARAMLRYGGNLSVANAVAYFGRNLDYVLVGTLSGAAALGLYHKAFRWASFPQQQVYTPAMKVAMSKLSRLQGSEKIYRASIRRTLMALYCIVAPIIALLFFEAGPAILVLLGAQWTEAIPLFRLLLIGIFFHSLMQLTKWIYKAEGRTGAHLRQTFISSPGMALGAGIGAIWGPVGIAIGFDIACGLLAPLMLWLCLRDSPLRMSDLVSALWAPGVASIIAGAAASWLVVQMGIENQLLHLLVSFLIMCPLYLLCFVALPRGLPRMRELRVAFAPLIVKRRRDADLMSDEDPGSRDNPMSP